MKLNDVIEVLGVLSCTPELAGGTLQQDDAAAADADMSDAELAIRPVGSLVRVTLLSLQSQASGNTADELRCAVFYIITMDLKRQTMPCQYLPAACGCRCHECMPF